MFDNEEWLRLREARRTRAFDASGHNDLEAVWFDYFPGIECTCDMLLLFGPWDDTRATFSFIYLRPKPLCNIHLEANPSILNPHPYLSKWLACLHDWLACCLLA